MKFNFKIRYLFLIIFLSLILVFSGCSSSNNDCSNKDSKYQKYQYNVDTSLCEISKTIQKDICGNGILEKGETYCNCPIDVEKTNPKYGCDGKVGNYLEKTCSEKTNTCILSQNDKIVEKTKSTEFKNSDISLKGDFILNTPFILALGENENKVDVRINLYKTTNSKINIKNILVKKLRILNSKNDILATINYNEGLSKIGDYLREKKISLSQTTKYSSSENLKLELEINYIKESLNSKGEIIKEENKIETLKSNIGRWDFINPNFYEK